MTKLARFFLPIIVLVALVITVPPYIIGYFVEKDMMSIQNKVPHNSGITLQVKNYQRGWFSSDSQLVMHFAAKDATHSPNGPSITFNNTIYHGPFIFAKNTKKTGSPFTFAKAFVNSRVSDPAKVTLTIQAKVAFGDKVHAFANAEKITYKLKGSEQGTSLIFQGINAKQTSSGKFTHVQTNFEMAAFDLFDKDQGHLQIKNIRHNSDFNEKSHDFWSGEGTTSVADFDLQTAKNARLEFQNFRLVQKSEEKAGRGFGTMAATIDQVKWNDQSFGKQIIEVSAKNFDTETLKSFTDAIEESQSQNLALLPFGKPFRALLTFLSKGLELSLDRLDVNTEWGRINADAKFTMPQSQTNLGTLEEVFEKFTAIANIKVPEPVVLNMLLGYIIQTTPEEQQANINPAMAQAQLQAFVDGGWIEKAADSTYLIKIKVLKGQLYLNDKVFEMPAPTASTITNNTQSTPASAQPTSTTSE